MTANEMRDWIIKQVESALPPSAPDPLSQADYEVMKKWWSDQIKSHINPEMCERLAVADVYAFPGLWASEVNRVMKEIEREMDANLAGSAAEGTAGAAYIDMGKLRRWLQHPASPKQPPQ